MAAILILLTFFVLYVAHKTLSYFFSEYYVLWSIARGGNRCGKPARNRLFVFICRSDYLDENSVLELYSFVGQQVNYALDVQEFHRRLLSFKYAVLYRDNRDGSLRGTSMVNLELKTFNEKRYMVMQCGACYFDRKYRGGSYKHYVMAYFRLKALLSHPFTPFLLVAEYFNYKPYAQLAHTFKGVYPSYRKETPDFMKEFINDFAIKTMAEGDKYDPETCVLKKAKFYFLKSHATESWAANTDDPHVRFFCECNPGWQKGHLLIAVAFIGLGDLLVLLRRMTTKAKNGSKRSRALRVLHRVSFQSEHANECASRMFHLQQDNKVSIHSKH